MSGDTMLNRKRLAWALRGPWHRRAQRLICRLGWHIAVDCEPWAGCCTFCGKDKR